jgi:hypothetical protein
MSITQAVHEVSILHWTLLGRLIYYNYEKVDEFWTEYSQRASLLKFKKTGHKEKYCSVDLRNEG